MNCKKTLLTLILGFILSGQVSAQWAVKTPLAGGARDASVCFTMNGKIYLGGGEGSKDFWRYDPAANTWTRRADIPGTYAYRGFAVGFVVNGAAYVGTGDDTSIYTVKNDLWKYDTTTDSWSQMASMPAMGRDGAFSFVINNIAYVGGGNDSLGSLHNDFWAYDPVANSWTAKASLPDYMIFPFAFSIGNYGFLSCGQQGASESQATWRYDPATDAWVSKAAYPGTVRQAGVAFVLDSVAYCGLGMVGYTTAYQDFYKYNSVTDAWTLVGNFAGGTDAWPAAAVYNHHAYVGTGWNFGPGYFAYWYEYTPPPASVISPGADKDIAVYPNPASGIIHINIPPQYAGKCSYTLCDVLGRQVGSGVLSSFLDINNLAKGEYFLKINGPDFSSIKMVAVQ